MQPFSHNYQLNLIPPMGYIYYGLRERKETNFWNK